MDYRDFEERAFRQRHLGDLPQERDGRDHIGGDPPARVADDDGVAEPETEDVGGIDPRVHARDHDEGERREHGGSLTSAARGEDGIAGQSGIDARAGPLDRGELVAPLCCSGWLPHRRRPPNGLDLMIQVITSLDYPSQEAMLQGFPNRLSDLLSNRRGAQCPRRAVGAADRARPAPRPAHVLRAAKRPRRRRHGHPRHAAADAAKPGHRAEGRGRTRLSLPVDGVRTALRPVLTELSRWGAHRLRLPDDLSTIPPRVPLTSLLLGATSIPRQANGGDEIRVEDEVVRIEVDGGCVHAAPDAEPEITIELTRPGLRALIRGARASELREADDVTVEGNARRAVVCSTRSAGHLC